MEISFLSTIKEGPTTADQEPVPPCKPCEELTSLLSRRQFRSDGGFKWHGGNRIVDWTCRPTSEDRTSAAVRFTYANGKEEDEVRFDTVKECREGFELHNKDGRGRRDFFSTCEPCELILKLFRESAGFEHRLRTPGGDFKQWSLGQPDCREREGKTVFYPRVRDRDEGPGLTEGGHGVEYVLRTGPGKSNKECVDEIVVDSAQLGGKVKGFETKKSWVGIRDDKGRHWDIFGDKFAEEAFPTELKENHAGWL